REGRARWWLRCQQIVGTGLESGLQPRHCAWNEAAATPWGLRRHWRHIPRCRGSVIRVCLRIHSTYAPESCSAVVTAHWLASSFWMASTSSSFSIVSKYLCWLLTWETPAHWCCLLLTPSITKWVRSGGH